MVSSDLEWNCASNDVAGATVPRALVFGEGLTELRLSFAARDYAREQPSLDLAALIPFRVGLVRMLDTGS